MTASRHTRCLGAGVLLMLAACSISPPPAPEEPTEPDSAAPQTVTLDMEQRETLGIATATVSESSRLAEVPGEGIVLERAQDLARTPGALPTAGAALLRELASGKVRLVRVTFPLSALPAAVPKQVRLARFAVGDFARNWTSTEIWDAPADPAVRGRSFFTVLRASDALEGERLQAWASSGTTVRGVTLPASAVIDSLGAFWCYIEKPAGTFTPTLVDTSRPLEGGYFVTEGVAAGDAVVTSGAELLLSQQTEPEMETGQ